MRPPPCHTAGRQRSAESQLQRQHTLTQKSLGHLRRSILASLCLSLLYSRLLFWTPRFWLTRGPCHVCAFTCSGRIPRSDVYDVDGLVRSNSACSDRLTLSTSPTSKSSINRTIHVSIQSFQLSCTTIAMTHGPPGRSLASRERSCMCACVSCPMEDELLTHGCIGRHPRRAALHLDSIHRSHAAT